MTEEIASDVWRVGGANWGLEDLDIISSDGDANVYLLKQTDTAILVDTGTIPGKRPIEANIRECGVAPQDLSALILTHSHYDHAQAAHLWQSTYAIPTYLNSVGAEFLQRNDFRLVGHPS